MSTHNICLSKIMYTGCTCNLKTGKLLDCALIRICMAIRLNTVVKFSTKSSQAFRGAKCLKTLKYSAYTD